MRAGILRHLVQVDRPVETPDATGDPVRTWTTVGSFSASIEPLRGREFTGGDAIRGDMDTRIRMRWSKSLEAMDETWRIRFASKIYNVVSVAHVALHYRELEISAKTGINEG